MCITILWGDEDISSQGEFREKFGPKIYFSEDKDDHCLCGINVEKILGELGFIVEWDEHGDYIIKGRKQE